MKHKPELNLSSEPAAEDLTSSQTIDKPLVIRCAGFIVEFFGDRSVGIFNQEWLIKGGFEFDGNDELTSFKEKIKEAFEYCSDTPIWIESLEERSARINAENAMYDGRHSV